MLGNGDGAPPTRAAGAPLTGGNAESVAVAVFVLAGRAPFTGGNAGSLTVPVCPGSGAGKALWATAWPIDRAVAATVSTIRRRIIEGVSPAKGPGNPSATKRSNQFGGVLRFL